MSSQWAATVLLALSLSFAAGQSSPSSVPIGRISGIVLDEQGQPMEQANVCVSATSKNGTASNCSVMSDAAGRFQTQQLEAGDYHVFAVKEDDGYSCFGQCPGDPATISASSPMPSVVIHMKPRGGMLTGSVTNKLTGEPIRVFVLRYLGIQQNMSGAGGGGNGKLSLTLPIGTDIIFVVTADGYQTWYYSEGGNPLLRLSSGEKKTLDVQLEPIKETASN